MPLYGEGILWYILIVDSIGYNILCWTRGKWHKKTTHWLSSYIPMNKVMGLLYLFLLLWIGSALGRLDILSFK
ncbi:hypothetical protein HYT55_03110 [Candidatus Woesearchaeota archaeon]|nr:hypothetical protein [Candidatus Woesearchaeota archaeon]